MASSQRLSRFHAELVETLAASGRPTRWGRPTWYWPKWKATPLNRKLRPARQEYEIALAELRRRIGVAECALVIEPAGELQAPEPPPAESEDSLIAAALASRPEIQSAKAQLLHPLP